jgi:hypothetical protein
VFYNFEQYEAYATFIRESLLSFVLYPPLVELVGLSSFLFSSSIVEFLSASRLSCYVHAPVVWRVH